MPYDWETSSIGSMFEEPTADNNTQQPMESLDFTPEMDEVEKRIEVAQYYRLLLQQPFFDEATEASERVEQEIREFVKGRLGILLGVKENTSYNSFTNEQIEVLTKFAALGNDGPEVIKVLMDKFFKKVEKGNATVSKPAKPQPKLRTVKTGDLKPKTAQAKPGPMPQQLNKAPTPAPKRAQSMSKKYPVEIPEQYKDDPTLKVEGNKIYVQVKNEAGEYAWSKDEKTGKTERVYKDVTPVAKPVGSVQPIPMPPPNQTEMITRNQAQRVMADLDQQNITITNQLKLI